MTSLTRFGFTAKITKKGYTYNKFDLHDSYRSLINNLDIPLLLCTGPPGTGKTMIACIETIQLLKEKKIEKIVITRPTKTVDEDLGFLPGSLSEKLHPFMIPIYDNFMEYFTKQQINTMVQNHILEIAPLAYMRGRTFKNTVVIADEMQNSSKNQFKMLLTRIGENSKIIVTGDLKQNDLNDDNGLNEFTDLLEKKYGGSDDYINNGIGWIKFDNSYIRRHSIIEKILDIYEN
jgi:phosphate starvation-inducible PhoH-like protein